MSCQTDCTSHQVTSGYLATICSTDLSKIYVYSTKCKSLCCRILNILHCTLFKSNLGWLQNLEYFKIILLDLPYKLNVIAVSFQVLQIQQNHKIMWTFDYIYFYFMFIVIKLHFFISWSKLINYWEIFKLYQRLLLLESWVLKGTCFIKIHKKSGTSYLTSY